MRERSYASEPGSRIALKLDAEKETVDGQDKNDINADDDDDDDTIECDVGVRTSTFSEPLDFGRRSQTLLDAQTPPATPPVVSVQQTKNPKILLLAHSKKQKTKPATSVFLQISFLYHQLNALQTTTTTSWRTHLSYIYSISIV